MLGHLSLTPEPLAPSLTAAKLTPERDGRVPRPYIELAKDRAVTLAWQRAMFTRVACEQVLRLAASHSACFSKPDELSALIDGLVRQRWSAMRLLPARSYAPEVQRGGLFSTNARRPSRPSSVLNTLQSVSIWFSTFRR